MEILLSHKAIKQISELGLSKEEALDAAVLPDYIREGRGRNKYFLKQCGERRLKLTVAVEPDKVLVLKAQWVHTE